jgi:hypothetical protein
MPEISWHQRKVKDMFDGQGRTTLLQAKLGQKRQLIMVFYLFVMDLLLSA